MYLCWHGLWSFWACKAWCCELYILNKEYFDLSMSLIDNISKIKKIRAKYPNSPRLLSFALAHFWTNLIFLFCQMFLMFSLPQSLKDHFFSILSLEERWAQWFLDWFWVFCGILYRRLEGVQAWNRHCSQPRAAGAQREFGHRSQT